MAKRHYELDTRVLTIFFFVAMPFVAFGSFLVVSMARGALQETIGAGFEQRAFETRFVLERYVTEQLDHLRLLALDDLVIRTLARTRPPAAPQRRQLERAWLAGGASAALDRLLESPAAALLRRVVQVHPQIKLLQLVDASGYVVASSSRAGRLDHLEAPWFRAMFEQAAYLGEIHRAPGAALPVLDLCFPIYDDNGQFIGAARALIDAGHLYGVLAPVRIGRTGRALLVRLSDGVILASRESQHILSRVYPGFAQIEAAMREHRPYWTIPAVREKGPDGQTAVSEPPRLVAFSPIFQVTSAADWRSIWRVENANWVVVIEQDLAEATAPIQNVVRYLWLHFIGAFGSVILMALYFSFKLEAPVIDEDLHLHDQHLPGGRRRAD